MIPIAAPDLGDEERDLVLDVLEGGQLADGPTVREFEGAFADRCDVAEGIATANGTAALHAALEGLSIGPGDRVVTTPFSFIATANAIRHVGADPVFVDVDPDTLCLDPDRVDQVLRREGDIDAVLVVHLFGRPAEMDRFRELADLHEVLLVEDAAQAHGASYNGRPVGSFGDVGCFSFYPTKNMTTGEGGMIVTDRHGVAETARTFVDHGRTDTYRHATVGHNFRMTSIAAAIGLAQLEKLSGYIEARRHNAARLTDGLAGTAVRTPQPATKGRHVYHQYTVRTEDREGLAGHLEREGVESAVYYPIPIHRQPAYGEVTASAPVSERAAEQVLSLPVHPGVDDTDVSRIVDAVSRFVGDAPRRKFAG